MSEILNQFPDDELPVSTVDIRRAIQAGRRRRVRAGLATAGTVVAVVAAGATAPVWLSPDPSPPTAPPLTCDAAQPSPSPSPTWEYFDPLVFEIDAGSVERYRVAAVTTSTYYQEAHLTDGITAVSVMLYAAKGEPRSITDEQRPIDPAAGEPAEPINGTPAYWLTPTDPVALAWQWTPGAWAIVSPFAIDPEAGPAPIQDDLRAIAREVAAQVKFGAATPVTSPFSLPLPTCLYPTVTLTYHSDDDSQPIPVSFMMGFDAVGTDPPSHIAGHAPYLWVTANAFASVDERPSGVIEYPQDLGYPAYQSDPRDLPKLWVYEVSGFGIEIEPGGVAGTPAEGIAYAADIFKTIAIYPGAATDPAAWGHPITP